MVIAPHPEHRPDLAIFLSAEWRWLVMLNYEVDPAIVQPHVPAGTEIDFWNGKTYLSLVGFLFLRTRVKGIPIPFHRDFEEVNLRFYVRRKTGEEWRRGVVFIKEIVPRWAISWVARTFYNENYVSLPMRHHVAGDEFRYCWNFNGRWNHLGAVRGGEPLPAKPGSEEEFITEHYWGYNVQADGSSLEYRVDHVPWRVWQTKDTNVELSVSNLYGPEFVEPLARRPSSAFLAEGSPVTIYQGRRLGNL